MANQSPLEGAQELQQMLVSYAKQETVDPLKALGKYLAIGLAGSFSMFLGVLFLALGALRLMQSETGDNFDGGSFASLVPYVVALAVLVLMIVVVVGLFSRAKKRVMS